MYQDLIATITSSDDAVRHRTEDTLLAGKDKEELLRMAEGLEFFRKQAHNLYHRVRACLFIHAIYRYYLIDRRDVRKEGYIPYPGVRAMLNREYDEAIERFRAAMMAQGCNEALLSALAEAYYGLAFKYLVDQVRQSVRTSRGNEWLFSPRTVRRYPLRVPEVYLARDPSTGLYPLGMDRAPVRADPSHAGWSDIFFLGMDFPEGARVINMSVDLAIHGQGEPVPPVECYCRVIDQPIIRLVSLDLHASKEVHSFQELFNLGNDHLGLLKAGVIASGVVPPCFEGHSEPLAHVLKKLLGQPGGFELVTRVRNIPKGSRLAVSTTLLATIITRLMRFSGQVAQHTGGLREDERRLVASRAILGEWLGGSGGGWQDSGGIWPGIKIIMGVEASKGDPEYGISRGRLLPTHTVLAREQLPADIEDRLARSIVMVHGGLSLNVGPILEMVTTRYLLRYKEEWHARLQGYEYFDDIVEAVKTGNMRQLGKFTTLDWERATKVMIPWTSNAFTEDLIAAVKEEFGKEYWGFLMLGGASGGGMAFVVNPAVHERFRTRVLEIMRALKRRYEYALPFAMEPVVYDFRLNYQGIDAQLWQGEAAVMPPEYYMSRLPRWEQNGIPSEAQAELRALATKYGVAAEVHVLHDALKRAHAPAQPRENPATPDEDAEAERIKHENGFDPDAHRRNQQLLKSGVIGVGKNRLPPTTIIEDVSPADVTFVSNDLSNATVLRYRQLGQELLSHNAVAVVTYAGGLGSRWTEGAAVVKVINPFVMMRGRHRSFAEIHLGKTWEVMHKYRQPVCHVFTTSFLTHEPLRRELEVTNNYGYEGPVLLSRGQSIAHRVYPMERDLRFLWEELPQQKLDEQAQKVQDNLRAAYIEWTRARGEGDDYVENVAVQRFNPPGHFFEVPNMLRNGTLAAMLRANPGLLHLMVHNADTLGVFLSPIMLGMHHTSGKTINFEVTPRRYEDKGGGLARVNGRVQLVEGLALPREEDEFKLAFYNTLTNWINIDRFLATLGLSRTDVLAAEDDPTARAKIHDALHAIEARVPTYVTIKDVKLLWGSGQEDVYPVAQFEKLWGDITWLEEFDCGFFVVERRRGQQLKEPAQLDRWVRDGSRDYVASKARFAR
ncbi:MAG: UTP--glucose-1-phosphate uridylyltransferase [bacterium]|nr:UTP--glucose-1-phosphate uridylyltransferase [bacterium]